MSDHPASAADDLSPEAPAQSWRRAAIDCVALFALLAGLNYATASADVGWFALNPTPYLVIPALLGVRYGFRAGVSAGLLTVLLLIVGRHLLASGTSLLEHRITLVSFPLLGALTGQVAEGLRKRLFELGQDKARLGSEIRHLHAERELLLLSRQDVQQRLELFGAESAPLDEELEELAETSREFAPAQLLATLERITRVRAAALYLVPEGSKGAPLTRAASIGEARTFPEFLYRQDHRIVEESLSGSAFLVQKSVMASVPVRSSGYLAAYPITGGDRTAVYLLVVQDVPFHEVRFNTFEVMKSICDWMRFALAAPLHREARHRAVNQIEFFQAIESAVTTHKQQSVPSTLARVPFNVADGVDPAGAFRDLLLALPRKAILTNANEAGRRSLLLLLPALSEPAVIESARAAFHAFGQMTGQDEHFQPHFFTTNPGETPQQMWGRLFTGDQDLASR